MGVKLNFPTEPCELLQRLIAKGHSAYFVGGCVRDSILGRSVYDYDVTTSAPPDAVVELFSDYRVVPTGLKHGTVTVIYKGYPIEITTFRSDGIYEDKRHPVSVEFSSSLEDDTKRRDFTINALCYNPHEGIVDHHGGLDDLKNGVLKCVGDPILRFNEDSLRILRGLRFASRFGFTIDPRTAMEMMNNCGLISNVSAERVLSEIKGFFKTEHSHKYVKRYFEVLKAACGFDADINVNALEATLESTPVESRLSVFFAVCGTSGKGAVELVSRLKPDKETALCVSAVAEAYYGECFKDPLSLAKTVRRYGTEIAESMHIVSVVVGRDVCLDASERIMLIKSGLLPSTPKHLAVNGDDVTKLGVTEGKVIGEVLEHLFEAVHLGVQNTKSALLFEAKRFLLKGNYK